MNELINYSKNKVAATEGGELLGGAFVRDIARAPSCIGARDPCSSEQPMQ